MRILSEINIHSTEEQILKFCQDVPMMAMDVQVRQMYMDYATNLLALKQQQKLLIEQNQYNQRQLFWARVVAISTVLSVLVALGILSFNPQTFNRTFGFPVEVPPTE